MTLKRKAPGATAGEGRKIARKDEENELAEGITPLNAYSLLLASLKSSNPEAYARRQEDEQGAGEDAPAKCGTQHAADDGSDSDGEDVQADVLSDADELQASTSVDEFKVHLEHTLTDEEVRTLEAPSWKLKAEVPASGIPKAKWIINRAEFPTSNLKLSGFNLKDRLRKIWNTTVKGKCGDFRSEQQSQFFALCNSYCDVLHSRKASLLKSKGASETMDAYLLHTLNHLMKTRDLVIKNNEKVAKNEKERDEMIRNKNSEVKKQISHFDAPRDQGFTRPKVLFLLPLRSVALQLVKRLIELSSGTQKSMVGNKEKFFEEFGAPKEEQDIPKQNKTLKPRDHENLFGGNNGDHFRIGLKFTRNSINLYSDFYSSDIVIASPLGLKTIIEEAEAGKDKDVDFLSSIEILVVDYSDVILMQNWSHVVAILEHLNKIPAKQHDTDIMRVREWYLNGQARYFRQTILLSSYADAAINALFLRSCFNHRGKIKLQCQHEGVLSSVVLQVRQVYERLDCSSITNVDDSRFEFFVKQVYPGIKDSLRGGYLVFVRSYFDYVRLRNFLKSQDASFCLLGEYTKPSDVSRARSSFFHGQKRIMLYTERAHFYNRFQIRGIRELVFYSLPDHGTFYAELTNMLEGVENPSCTAIYSSFDNLQLERIVGTVRAKKLLSSKTKTSMFC